MRINNNIMAMNTHRQYGINNTNIAKSIEKLSSGYRVNRAGDDAAGLAISEKMRAQIRGLQMASKNSQDAISLVQTAEGALQTTHNVLQRMRELAVQSASDTNETKIDRAALDKEFQQLIKEIDDTANKARFNDMGVIDGSYAENIMTAAAGGTGNSAWAGPSVAVGAYDVTFSTVSTVAEVKGAVGTGTVGTAFTVGTTDGSVITATYTTPGSSVGNETDTANGVWTFGYNSTSKMFTMTNGATSEVLTAAAGGLAIGGSMTLDFGKAGSVKLDNATATFTIAGIGAVAGDVTVAGAVTSVEAEYAHYAALNGEQIQIHDNQRTIAFTNSDISLTLGTLLSGVGKFDDDTATAALGTITIDVSKSSNNAMVIQTGANQGDELSVTIEEMTAQSIGVRAASIATRLDASTAITQVNSALNIVSMQRADLGALQNRLEFKIQNLDISAENLQAAESRIRDLDMAKEMTNFTRNNILAQAATAMLAQANALPQGVLQLLG